MKTDVATSAAPADPGTESCGTQGCSDPGCADSACAAGGPGASCERPCPSAEELWRSFRGGLRSFLERRLRRREDVEDVLQEIFLKIHRERCSLESGEKVEAWVYRIARHTVTDFYRAKARRPEAELPDDFGELFPVEEPTDIHETVLAWLEPMAELLPEKYREPLILADFHGLPQQEVAARLGISLSGAKSRVQRARVQLGEMLHECCTLEVGGDGRVVGYSQNQPSCKGKGC